jgi:VRR-NUC domain-containing protein
MGAVATLSTVQAMTEDELLQGITDAMTLGGWRWMHIRRSDGITVGMQGFPDLIAAHPEREYILVWELKSQTGVVMPDQAAWLHVLGVSCVDARVIRPEDYDQALEVVLKGRDPREVWDWVTYGPRLAR